MFYARVRPVNTKSTKERTIGAFGDALGFETLEDLWVYVHRNLYAYMMEWAIPRCPPYLASLDFIGHADDTYITRADTVAVFGWQFIVSRYEQAHYILEVWDADADIGLRPEHRDPIYL